MKKCTVLLLAVVLILSFADIGFVSAQDVTPPRNEPGTNAEALDGKKVLFVGCSFLYYGGTVIPFGDANLGVRTQDLRAEDEGFFYQLCKANGADVSVMDWTYGGHSLKDIFSNSCQGSSSCFSYNHLSQLIDRNYDYVILLDTKNSDYEQPEDFRDGVKAIMDIFREENPDVKIFYMIHDGVYASNYSNAWKQSVQMIEEEGAVIIDWGTLVWDIVQGYATVPDGTQSYNKSSFIVSKSQSDGYHPNILTGYLTALMTYCAITGETAVGQPYSFCIAEEPIDSRFNPDGFIAKYYQYDDPKTTDVDESKTNFIEIFESDADMLGLQLLVDKYSHNKAWLKHVSYEVRFEYEDGTEISTGNYHLGDVVIPPTDPVKAAEPGVTYTFAGWDKKVGPCEGNTVYIAVFTSTTTEPEVLPESTTEPIYSEPTIKRNNLPVFLIIGCVIAVGLLAIVLFLTKKNL